MAKQRKPFACPGCQKTVKVPVEHLGSRVKCPKCDSIFRAGPKSLKQEEVIYAELDDDMPSFESLLPTAALVSPQPLPPVSAGMPRPSLPANRGLPAYQSPRAVIPPTSKSRKQTELTEQDSRVQGTGFFLISLPLVATLLPLFGFQLRRLAKLGDFAPLAAMVLGLIGVGCICYARRNRSDAVIFSGASAAFVTLCGIGGFLLLSSLPTVEDSPGQSGAKESVGRYMTTVDPATRAQQLRDQAEARHEEAKRIHDPFANHEAMRRQHQEIMDQHRKRAFEQHDEIRQRMRQIQNSNGFPR